ncbi:hypothetical protein Tco_0309770 [Tanacetum coccineum]
MHCNLMTFRSNPVQEWIDSLIVSKSSLIEPENNNAFSKSEIETQMQRQEDKVLLSSEGTQVQEFKEFKSDEHASNDVCSHQFRPRLRDHSCMDHIVPLTRLSLNYGKSMLALTEADEELLQEKDSFIVSKKRSSDSSKKLKGIQTLTPAEQEAADIMKALKESKKMSKRQPCETWRL